MKYDEQGRDPGLLICLERVGTIKRLADICGVSGAAVSQWKSVPIHHVLMLEQKLGISRYTLRPDVYGAEYAGTA